MKSRRNTPEELLIRELIRATFNNSNPEKLENFLKTCNPLILAEKIKRHGLSAYFYQHFSANKSAGSNLIPSMMLDAWKEHAGRIALKNTLIEQESLEFFKFLKQAQIDFILLKGFAYAEKLYGSKWIRPLGDIDILVEKIHYPIIREFLLNEGFRYSIDTGNQLTTLQLINLNETDHNQMHFSKRVGLFCVSFDVHWEIADLIQVKSPMRQIYPLNSFDWYANRLIIKIEELDIHCLSPEMQFMHMVYHFGLGHQFAGCKWLIDICLFYNLLGNALDWDMINKHISLPDCQKLFTITENMVQEVLGSSQMPQNKWQNKKTINSKQFEYRFYRNRLFASYSKSSTYIAYLMLPASLRNRFKMFKYIFFCREALPEWQISNKKVPAVLQPFYIIIRGISEILFKHS